MKLTNAKKTSALLVFISFFSISSAKASFVLPLELSEVPFFNTNSDFDTYQIGSMWGKVPVSEQILQNETEAFNRAAYSTGKLGGGTGFYLGKFAGVHVVGTNHHVCETGSMCLGTDFNLTLLGKRYRLEKFLGTFKDADLTLLTIVVPEGDEALLKKFAKNFAFKTDLVHGQELLTIGYGIANNSRRQLVANQDSDCIVFSKTAEYRQMKDPDDINPGEDEVWSFSNGCDVSHGDSGSAMVDRSTSKVMGLIWTGRIPKNKRVQDSNYLANLLKEPNNDIWDQLSYAVPAIKIADYLFEAIKKDNTPALTKKVFLEMLDNAE